MEYKRADRVADQIQKEISDIVFRKVKDPRVSKVTITAVEVSPDLQNARIFFCVMGSPSDEEKKTVIDGLNKARGFMRQELGRRLALRYVPNLAFHYDGSYEYGDKIERLLKELHKDEEPET